MLLLRPKKRLNLRIVDYGMGNIGSIRNAFKAIGVQSHIARKHHELEEADGLILPGVGGFAQAMKAIRERDLIEPLNHYVLDKKKPVLGICLGQQLMAQTSQEGGETEGLGWIPGHVVQFDKEQVPRIPHVGWSALKHTGLDPVLFYEAEETDKFYFTHSYMLMCPHEYVSSYCQYGKAFAASIRYQNIFATQFHPEKSQLAGSKMLRNFSAYCLEKVLEEERHAK